jgi:hypothetical protein
MLPLPSPDLRALATGTTVVAFVPRGAADAGDEVVLHAEGSRPPATLQAPYRAWAEQTPPDGEWSAVVVSVDPAGLIDGPAGAPHHILAHVPDGDLLVLRVYGPDGAVLDDDAFAARRRDVEGTMAP